MPSTPLVNAPVWTAISRFGRPYPPFDFGSGMGTRDVERDEAERLGVIAPGEQPGAEDPDYNADLAAGAKGYLASEPARAMLKQAFGDQIFFEWGRAVWAGNKIVDMADAAISQGPNTRGSFRFGRASGIATNKAAANGIQDRVEGASLVVEPTHLYHALERHGPRDLIRTGSGERSRGQLPVRKEEFANLNTLWMDPQRVGLDRETRDGILFQRSVRGGVLEMVLRPNQNNPAVLHPVSIRKKKRGGEGS